MKKIIYLFFFIPLMINLAACYDDTGNYDYTDLPDVDIKMQDTVYATQFKTLELTADVDLNDAPESDYEFNWRIWSNEIGGVWEQKEIGNSRNLTYEVAEIPGSYTLVLTVTNKKTEVKTHGTGKYYRRLDGFTRKRRQNGFRFNHESLFLKPGRK